MQQSYEAWSEQQRDTLGSRKMSEDNNGMKNFAQVCSKKGKQQIFYLIP